ncbi:MAG: EF-Tu/IF-2/RF-3 family GTPase, partial [Clostridia bacterium]
MEEIESTLGIRAYPMNWPVGTGTDFRGIYNRSLSRLELFEAGGRHGQDIIRSSRTDAGGDFAKILGEFLSRQLRDDIELLDMAGEAFDLEKVQSGDLTPMFFGSAMTNFGVEPFLEEFLRMAPYPADKMSTIGRISAFDPDFSGFVFKIQANMDPAHRDRIAFIRICSGEFEKGMQVHHMRTGKPVRLSQPQQFFAQERSTVEQAYAGDIIGVFDPGIFHIGDTLCSGKGRFHFEGIPIFPAEHFAVVRTRDAMKRKQFLTGIRQIAEEGAIQVFKQPNSGTETLTIGVVGVLQLEVLEYRLKNEYGVDIRMERLPYSLARWVQAPSISRDLLGFGNTTLLVEDKLKRPVILFLDQWTLNRTMEKNKEVAFFDVAPDS